MAEIIIIMPTLASMTRMGYSKRAILTRFMKWLDRTMATAEPKSAMTFITRAKVSTTKAPPNAVTLPSLVKMTSEATKAGKQPLQGLRYRWHRPS